MCSVLIAGDFCPQNRVAQLFEIDCFDKVFGEIKVLISKYDYSIVNLECPVTNGDEKPIEKQGENLRCSEKGLDAIKWAGFDCVTLANNHFCDFGETGVKNTIQSCSELGIDTVGGGEDLSKASNVLYKKISDKIIAILNCCEHEFSIATHTSGGSNPLNPVRQYYSIVEAKSKSDYVIVIVHGGNEYFQLPSPRMKELYRFFIDIGADAVINHHQHCYSGYEVYKDKPIFYGIGNFCFDDSQYNNMTWNEGFLAVLNFGKNNKVDFELHPYSQCGDKPCISLMSGEIKKSFNRKVLELNHVINNDDLLGKKYDEFLEESKEEVNLLYLPVVNRFTIALCRRHILPRFVSRKNKYRILNFLLCESHYPKIVKYIQNL